MNASQTTSKLCRTPTLLALVLPLVAGNAAAITYNLVAAPFDKAMPDGTLVTMWGFALDGTSCPAVPPDTCPASVPGPALVVEPGDTSLTVNLTNNLPEATSIVIPGQAMPTGLAPVKFTDGSGRQRVRSFTAEAAAGGGTQSYTWNNLKPGTFLYHSGTHPQVQVQMGLYGAMTHDAVAGEAYAGVPYHNEVTLLFSEVDPVLHAAVANNRYGATPPDPLPPGLTAADYPSSTIDYAPKYFLINGQDLSDASLALAAGNAGQITRLRLLNAGLQSRSPVLQGHYMRLVAEDGNPYPYAREQYSAFLPALKTVDAVITPVEAATYPVYDRRLAYGMLAHLTVAEAGAGAPSASPDAYVTDEDTQLSVAAPGVLANDAAFTADPATTAQWHSGPSHGTLNLATDGSFTYLPTPNYNGSDSFAYQAVSGGEPSLPTTVSLTVNPLNDPPVAADNAYSVTAGDTLNVAAPGILGNDSDIDGDTLSAVNHSVLAGLTPSADGGFSYNATAAGEFSFTYQASDGNATSDPATVTITVTAVVANVAPVAVNDTFSVARNATNVPLNVLANDTDADGNLDPTTVTIVVNPNKGGSVNVDPVTGIVRYTPRTNFRGSENFSYTVQDAAGETSNVARVRVNVK
ncbi:MAG: Ig-like domain-containing protein [Thiobacillus sp.]|nr:Ig-like domain-containing protein [Thiobacillus sp.]